MENHPVKGDAVVKNIIWSLLERWGAQGVTFVVSIILARLLEPEMYGLTALVTVFTAILSVFIDSGLGSALVQKKDADELDFSTVFYFNVAMCFVLYCGMFLAAPWIADFYKIPELIPIVRVMSLTLIISGVKNILISYIQRNLLYKKFFFATLGGTIGAAFIGIYMAAKGFGVWALIVQSLFNSTVDTIILWVVVKWRPKLQFSFERLKKLLSFGVKILATTLIGTVYGKLRELIIGKKYSAVDLAYYNKAMGWPNLLFVNIGGALDSVMYPVMSRVQDDRAQIRAIMSRIIRINTFVVFPMLAGLAVCAEPAVRLVLTDKWLPIVPYMRIFCAAFAIEAIDNTERNMIRSAGRGDLFLKLEIAKKTASLVVLLITMRLSVMDIAYGLMIADAIGLCINLEVVGKVLDYPLWDQILDFMPNLGLSTLMMIPVYCLSKLHLADYIILAAQVIVGALFYAAAAKCFRMESYDYVLDLIKNLLRRSGNSKKRRIDK